MLEIRFTRLANYPHHMLLLKNEKKIFNMIWLSDLFSDAYTRGKLSIHKSEKSEKYLYKSLFQRLVLMTITSYMKCTDILTAYASLFMYFQ